MTDHIAEWTLNDYVEGLLPPAEVAEVEGHLASCAACAAEVASYRSLFSQLATLPDAPLERDLTPAILAAIQPVAPVMVPRRATWGAIVLQGMVAALLAVVAWQVVGMRLLTLQPVLVEAGQAWLASQVSLWQIQGMAWLMWLESWRTVSLPSVDLLPSLSLTTSLTIAAVATVLWWFSNRLLLGNTLLKVRSLP